MPFDVFVSYSRSDRIKAGTIAHLLETCGWRVWWDRDLDPGEQWESEVLGIAGEAKCVLVIWSRDSVQKEWVRREAQIGVERNTLVPVFLQPAGLPTPTDQVQGVRLSTWAGDQPSELLIPLLNAVQAKAGQPAARGWSLDVIGAELERAVETITAAEVAEAAFEYCSRAIEWERLRQSGHRFAEEDLAPKQEAYDRIKSFFDRPGSELDDEDFHELVSRFLDALYPDYEKLGTGGAIKLTT
jgi:TIR domain